MKGQAPSQAGYVGYPEVDLAAVRYRLDAPLAFWYAARALDERGEGRTRIGSLPDLPPRTLGRVLERGEGRFWVRAQEGIFLRSLPAVAASLGVGKLTACYQGPVWWPRDRPLWRPRLALNAFAVLRRGLPVSVATIAHLLGVSRRTVFAWLKATRWRRTENLALRLPVQGGGVLRLARKYADRPGRLRVVRTPSGLYLAERLPNSLVEVTERAGGRAALRRANRLLSPCVHRGRGQRQKLYLRPGERRRLTSTFYRPHPTPGKDGTQFWLPPSRPPLTTGEVFARQGKP